MAQTKDEMIETIIRGIKESKKYADTSEDTIRELVLEEFPRHKKRKQIEKAVRTRLHSIMAPYLGDPNYAQAKAELREVFQSGDDALIRDTCAEIMNQHHSCEERWDILPDFYEQIFAVTGKPKRILDIACGLNPLAIDWMDLPALESYYAYDIHEGRIDLLNTYFDLKGLPQVAKMQDIAYDFPQEEADLALFLKELPRFERHYGKRSREMLQALRVRYLVISFPAVSLHGGRSLVKQYRDFFYKIVDGLDWQSTEINFDSELVFCVDKEPN